MKLKKCRECGKYGLKEMCEGCGGEMREAHYKFVKVRSLREKLKKTAKPVL